MTEPRHVILIVFDTLRRDAVGAYGVPTPWGSIATPNLDRFARESIRMDRIYPESLPTLCARRAIYTGMRTYPFHDGDFKLKGDFPGVAPGWGPIPEHQDTLSEILHARGFRTALISDLYHQFKPSKNFWRGFDQWQFIRGQETDPGRSGPLPSQDEMDRWVPRELQDARRNARRLALLPDGLDWFSSRCVLNMRDRVAEELWFNAQVFQESHRWLEQNRDADRVFLTIESFDPHEPWFVPEHYRRMYDDANGQEQVLSPYTEMPDLSPELVKRTRANYSGLVTMCDRWFGHLMESIRTQGWLDDSLVIVTSDHGHSIWEGHRRYIGKRGYPSEPGVVDIPTFVRLPGGAGGGGACDAWSQHHDIAPTILEALGIAPNQPMDGQSFWRQAIDRRPGSRDSVTIGWGSAMTVVDDRWWFNAKVNGAGAFLHDRTTADPFRENLASENPDHCRRLFEVGAAEARGGFPDFLLELAKSDIDAPGCSPIAVY
jgi:arylsulfatase A-like enzyme